MENNDKNNEYSFEFISDLNNLKYIQNIINDLSYNIINNNNIDYLNNTDLNNYNELNEFDLENNNEFEISINCELFQNNNYKNFIKNISSINIINKKSELFVNSEKCIICMQKYKIRECVVSLNKCCHNFHKRCFIRWIKKNNSCPICRQLL